MNPQTEKNESQPSAPDAGAEAVPSCLVPDCGRLCDKGNHARGMCSRCYAEARRMVSLHLTSWLELQNRGLAVLPERKVKPKKPTPLATALASARRAERDQL